MANQRIFFRRSHPNVFCKKGALKCLPKLRGKHVYRSLFQKKICTLYAWNSIWKEAHAKDFFGDFLKTHQNSFFIEHIWMAASDIMEYMETLTINEDLRNYLKILTIIIDFTGNTWDFGVAMKQSENRTYSMILLRKWNINESHWPHTLQIYTVWKPRVEIGHTLMEISLNLGFYRFLLQRNVDQFNFIFFKEYFFTRPVI